MTWYDIAFILLTFPVAFVGTAAGCVLCLLVITIPAGLTIISLSCAPFGLAVSRVVHKSHTNRQG